MSWNQIHISISFVENDTVKIGWVSELGLDER